MTELFETYVDGVRCFWVNSGRPTLAAMLMFRYGGADEPLPESGWQHLLEHLALHGRGGGTLAVNGSVTPLLTTFEAHGPVDQVVDHLSSLSRWLAAPDVGDLDRERNVLAAESATRGSAVLRALSWRYVARGPGVMS